MGGALAVNQCVTSESHHIQNVGPGRVIDVVSSCFSYDNCVKNCHVYGKPSQPHNTMWHLLYPDSPYQVSSGSWSRLATMHGRNNNINPPMVNDFRRSSLVNGGIFTPRCISGSRPPSAKIPTAIPMFSGSNVSMVTSSEICDVIFNRK